MNKILIYGDSNVWGDNFLTGERIPYKKQWPNILEALLGKNYKILQEGLPGRLAGEEEQVKKYKNGKYTFLSTFRTSAPVNQVIIMLGTNDLQIKYQKSSQKIIEDLLWYYQIILEEFEEADNRKKYFKNNRMPKFLFLLPNNVDYLNAAKDIFDDESMKKRSQVIQYFQNTKHDFKFLVLENIPLFEDGIHLNYTGHEILAHLVKGLL